MALVFAIDAGYSMPHVGTMGATGTAPCLPAQTIMKGFNAMSNRFCLVAVALWLTLSAAGCATYKVAPVSFKTPAAYANAQTIEGAQVAAKGYADAQDWIAQFLRGLRYED